MSLPREDILCPHVEIQLYGESEGTRKSWSTLCYQNENQTLNGLHPVWDVVFPPHLLTDKDMTFLDFTIVEVSLMFCPNNTYPEI